MTLPPDKTENTEGTKSQQPMSYSDRLKTNIRYNQRLKRNVLEITLERVDTEVEGTVETEDVARICQTLGIDIKTQVEGFNIHFKGKVSILCLWLVAGINLEKYCRDVSLRVGNG